MFSVRAACLFVQAPPLYVLDEATSSLDSLTEAEVQASLRAAAKHATVLVVALRCGGLDWVCVHANDR